MGAGNLSSVLMGWELGEGLGHVQKLLRVARALKAEGHRPVFALANIVDTWPLLQHEDVTLLQAPHWHAPARGGRAFTASSFADVLAVRGWSSVENLSALVAAWQELLDRVQPGLIVADFSPTLCLAAYRALPLVLIGSWFSLPPAEGIGFPLLVPGQEPVLPQEAVLAIVQEVQKRRRRPVPSTLHDILAAGELFPLVVSELDPYHDRRGEKTWDPLEPLPSPRAPAAVHSFFAYLTAENASVEAVLTNLALTGSRGTVYLRSASAAMKERLRLQGLTVLDQPATADEMLNAAIIVHHGGLGVAQAALAAGRLQILLPQHLEQAMTAHRIDRLGVGTSLAGSYSDEAAARALEKMQNDHRFSERALALAQDIQSRPRRQPLPVLLERCRHYLNLGKT